jgi:hypothetical protein
MPNDFSIQAAGSVNFGNGGAAPMQPAVTGASIDQAEPTPSQSPAPNPTLQLNAALGLVVIEFRNDAGAITSSIPSQQQLNAYRLWQTAGIGSPPNLGDSAAGIAATPGGPTATATAQATTTVSATGAAQATATPSTTGTVPGMRGGDGWPTGSRSSNA